MMRPGHFLWKQWGEPTQTVPGGVPTYPLRTLVKFLLNYLCAATGHAGGCYLLNGPLRRLWAWSLCGKHETTWTA